MNAKMIVGWYLIGTVSVSLTAAEPKVRYGGGIKDNKSLRMSASTLALAERRSENLLKTKFQREMEQFHLADVQCEDMRIDDFLKLVRKQVEDNGGPRVNLLLRASAKQRAARLTMDMQDIPVSEVLRYVAFAAGLDFRVDEHVVVMEPKSTKKEKK